MSLGHHLVAAGLLLGVLCCSSTDGATAQSRSDTATLKVDSRLVVLDVSITDNKGNPVLDLRKDEVRVYEGDQLQTVRTFEPPQTHAMPAGSAWPICSSQRSTRLSSSTSPLRVAPAP